MPETPETSDSSKEKFSRPIEDEELARDMADAYDQKMNESHEIHGMTHAEAQEQGHREGLKAAEEFQREHVEWMKAEGRIGELGQDLHPSSYVQDEGKAEAMAHAEDPYREAAAEAQHKANMLKKVLTENERAGYSSSKVSAAQRRLDVEARGFREGASRASDVEGEAYDQQEAQNKS